MTGREQAERLWSSVLDLGAKRLAALALVGLTVFAVVGLGGVFLSRPKLDVLYSGLDRDDVTRIGAALNEAGITFDVNAAGDTVLVRYAQTGQARMLLAEKGLPQSANAGYELFDKLGSLGLTSFMQEVTKVRALEGEIARTIQLINGVKAARVHIVLPDDGSFRRTRQPPSASVIIRTDAGIDGGAAQAIRHLVSAAIPGMQVDQVTVLNTDGHLLASGDDTANAGTGKMMTLETSLDDDIQEKIRKTLTPYLGLENFQVSVAARLNTDKKQTSETSFDPDSRIERSVRVVKENETSQNMSTPTSASVDQNLPDQPAAGGSGDQSTNENNKREETTNYELSSKTVTTTSEGYTVENLSIAVLVNRARLAKALGDKATPEQVNAQLAEIQALVASAAGVNESRGDQLKVSAVDFISDDQQIAAIPPVGMGELMIRQMGTVINAATILIVAVLLIWFGLRPATRALLARPVAPEFVTSQEVAGEEPRAGGELGAPPDVNLIEDLTRNPRRSPQKRLEQIVQFDEDHAAAILKQWMQQGERA